MVVFLSGRMTIEEDARVNIFSIFMLKLVILFLLYRIWLNGRHGFMLLPLYFCDLVLRCFCVQLFVKL